MSVTNGTPSTLLSPGWVVTTATPSARFSEGRRSPSKAIHVGGTMPPPMPARMRKTAALGRFGASAVPIEARPTSNAPASKIGFRP